MNKYQESRERGEIQKENERWVTHGPFSSERLITTEKMEKMMVTEKMMMPEKKMMTEKMAKMMSRGVTHGPARCSLGPAQLTKLASGGSAGRPAAPERILAGLVLQARLVLHARLV